MPLIHKKSEKALSANIATEVKAGKPVDQACAIGYSVQREAHKAEGGKVEEFNPEQEEQAIDEELQDICAEELIQAIETKDKRQILDAIKALVLSIKE